MCTTSRWIFCGPLAAIAFSCCAGIVTAGPLPAASVLPPSSLAPIHVGDRWDDDYDDGDYDDDDYYYPPEYYLPPPPVVRVIPVTPPPAVVYEPPVYGWIAPLRPSNCGKYRYWNGERCADARYDPPYVGPRW
jgi:hypothetical protein